MSVQTQRRSAQRAKVLCSWKDPTHGAHGAALLIASSISALLPSVQTPGLICKPANTQEQHCTDLIQKLLQALFLCLQWPRDLCLPWDCFYLSSLGPLSLMFRSLRAMKSCQRGCFRLWYLILHALGPTTMLSRSGSGKGSTLSKSKLRRSTDHIVLICSITTISGICCRQEVDLYWWSSHLFRQLLYGLRVNPPDLSLPAVRHETSNVASLTFATSSIW